MHQTISERLTRVNELLFYLFNNLELLNELNFINSVIKFYNSEAINVSKKILFADLDTFKMDKFKISQRTKSKNDILLDIIDAIKFCIENKLELPVYVAADIKKIPEPKLEYFNSLFELNIKMFENKLIEQKNELIQIINSLVLKSSTSNAKSCIHKQATAEINKTCTTNNANNICSALWADLVNNPPLSQNESNDEMSTDVHNTNDFQVVRPRKAAKRKKSSSSPQMKQTSEGFTPKIQQLSKTFGTSGNCELKSSKIIVKSLTYYVGNLKSCSKEVIEKHLKNYDISFYHCFPVFRKKKSNDASKMSKETPTESTAFKIILPQAECDKLTNPEIWPQYSFFHEWDFNYSSNKINNTKTHNG